jgi:hypothetical protein
VRILRTSRSILQRLADVEARYLLSMRYNLHEFAQEPEIRTAAQFAARLHDAEVRGLEQSRPPSKSLQEAAAPDQSRGECAPPSLLTRDGRRELWPALH